MQDVQEPPLCLPKRIKEPWNMVQSIRDTPLAPGGTVADIVMSYTLWELIHSQFTRYMKII